MGKQRHSERRSHTDRQQLARELARLAELGGTGNDAAERRAWKIISQCIERQDDATLANGLVQTIETEAHETLWQQINFFASTTLMQERSTGAPLLTELFAIPVLFSSIEAIDAPTALPSPGELTRLAKRHGLLNHRNDRIFWLPQLFTHEQLAQLSWSGLYGMTTAMTHKLLRLDRGAELSAFPDLPDATHPMLLEDSNCQIRFIVGGVHFNPDIADMPLLREENSEKYQSWCTEVADHLRLSAEVQVLVCEPALIPEALVHGQMQLRLHEFCEALIEALTDTDTETDALSVYISVHGESEAAVKEFRIAAYAWDDPEEQVFARIWEMAPHENPNEVARQLCDLLEAVGVINLFFIGEVLPEDRCDCCGGPLFRGPLEGDVTHSADIHPGTRVLH